MPESNVYLGDCMDFMKGVPDTFFDLAVVDPEFGIGIGNSPQVGNRQRIGRKIIGMTNRID